MHCRGECRHRRLQCTSSHGRNRRTQVLALLRFVPATLSKIQVRLIYIWQGCARVAFRDLQRSKTRARTNLPWHASAHCICPHEQRSRSEDVPPSVSTLTRVLKSIIASFISRRVLKARNAAFVFTTCSTRAQPSVGGPLRDAWLLSPSPDGSIVKINTYSPCLYCRETEVPRCTANRRVNSRKDRKSPFHSEHGLRSLSGKGIGT